MFNEMIQNITNSLADVDTQLASAQATVDVVIADIKKAHAEKVADLKDQRKKLTKALSALQDKAPATELTE